MKNYITIGKLCIGFGRPPKDLYEQRLKGAWPRLLPLKPKDDA